MVLNDFNSRLTLGTNACCIPFYLFISTIYLQKIMSMLGYVGLLFIAYLLFKIGLYLSKVSLDYLSPSIYTIFLDT